jgi:hypothetical protein
LKRPGKPWKAPVNRTRDKKVYMHIDWKRLITLGISKEEGFLHFGLFKFGQAGLEEPSFFHIIVFP